MSELVRITFKVLEKIGLINFIEEVALPKTKCLLKALKGQKCEECSNDKD